MSGERGGDDPRRAAKHSDESLSTLVQRREREVSQAESLGVALPAQVKGVLFEEGAGLTRPDWVNVDAKQLRSMDTTREKLTDARAARALPVRRRKTWRRWISPRAKLNWFPGHNRRSNGKTGSQNKKHLRTDLQRDLRRGGRQSELSIDQRHPAHGQCGKGACSSRNAQAS